ncbi:MAG: endonuclease/exonuclease/phosphatase family protein [Elusimicrobiota bacterium]
MKIALVLLWSLAAGLRAQSFADPSSLQTLRGILKEAKTPKTPPRAPFALRVLTYNVHGIAPWLVGQGALPDQKALGRYREMARRLRELRAQGKAPQIVAIQEAWNGWSSKAATEAGYPYVTEGGSARFGKLTGAGLFIMSEYPVFTSETMNYSDCTGFDCLATKGAQHVRVVIPELGRAIDIYNTHMNADEAPAKPEDSLKARMAQIKEYAAFVKRTRDAAATAVLAGDFNFASSGPDYKLFDGLLSAVNASKACVDSKDCTGDDPGPIWTEAIDHQFTLAGARRALKAAFVARTFKEPHDGKPLSDHLGLEAHYLFAKP